MCAFAALCGKGTFWHSERTITYERDNKTKSGMDRFCLGKT